MIVNADTAASASHQHAFQHLCGPFIDGARERPVPLDAAGFAAVAGPLRHPGRGRVLLAGDAGGFVNGFTAEGLYYAMV